MYEVKQAQIARAIDILRAGPLTAAQFAARMWPDRAAGKAPGKQSMMGHGLLRRLGELNYIEKIGSLWMIRRLDGATSATLGATNGHANGYPLALESPAASPVGLLTGPANGQLTQQVNGQTKEQADRLRLAWLVQQATEPVGTVTHDVAFGNLAVRGMAVDAVLAEACAIVVLAGRSANVYLPCGAPYMLVGLSPAEGARALFLRWQQSSQPPELPRSGAWITIEDGIVATPGYWRPLGASPGWVEPEDVRVRVARQRRAAGLA
jgi:hypothetical protein